MPPFDIFWNELIQIKNWPELTVGTTPGLEDISRLKSWKLCLVTNTILLWLAFFNQGSLLKCGFFDNTIEACVGCCRLVHILVSELFQNQHIRGEVEGLLRAKSHLKEPFRLRRGSRWNEQKRTIPSPMRGHQFGLKTNPWFFYQPRSGMVMQNCRSKIKKKHKGLMDFSWFVASLLVLFWTFCIMIIFRIFNFLDGFFEDCYQNFLFFDFYTSNLIWSAKSSWLVVCKAWFYLFTKSQQKK